MFCEYETDYDPLDEACEGCSGRKPLQNLLPVFQISSRDVFCGSCVKELIKIVREQALIDKEIGVI